MLGIEVVKYLFPKKIFNCNLIFESFFEKNKRRYANFFKAESIKTV